MRTAPFLAVLAAAAVPALASDPARPLPPEPPRTAAITAEEILWQNAWLSDDARGGRETGSPGCREAAAWIAARMEAMGLEKVPGADGWFQRWPMPGGEVVPKDCSIEVKREKDAGTAAFAYGKDFVDLAGTGGGEIEAPVVFAGYGITAPEMGYDDYAGVDVRGKVVLVLRHEPGERDPESKWNGDRMTRHSGFLFKAMAANRAGAAAVLVVNDPLHHEDDPLEALALGLPGLDIPFLLASRRVAETILGGDGGALVALQRRIDEGGAPVSFAPEGVRVRVRMTLKRGTTENVVGMLRGSDPGLRDEWVIVGAHYDHVGLGAQGSMDPAGRGLIHNGADDNASGTSALLEIAEHFALSKERPRRSLLFLAFSGEEKGLLGSRHYTMNPLVPLDRAAAMINLDMVGRYRPGLLSLVGADSGSGMREILDRAAEGLDLEYDFSNGGLNQSDGFNFHEAKVPVVFFFTGFHDDYHRPGDDWWKIEAAGSARVAAMAARTARLLADADVRPAFRAIPRREMRFARTTRPVLGVVPADAPDGGGALMGTVSPNSPAATAGILEGDRVVSFGGAEVKDAAGLRAAILRTKPGEEVAVRLVRGEKTLDVTVEFPGPRPPAPVFGIVFAAASDGRPGVPVEEVSKGSVAEAAGLKRGDRILSFGEAAAADATALGEALSKAKPGDTVKVRILRDGKETVLDAAYPDGP